MGKFLSIFFCIIAGIAISGLSMITDTLECSNLQNYCRMQSKISGINRIISEKTFLPSEINKVYCDKMYRPARSGKKAFFALKMTLKDSQTEYNLGSFPKYAMCKQELEPIQKFVTGKNDTFTYSSGLGAANIIGFMLAVIMFVISFVILTNEPENKTYEWDNDESEEKDS